MKIITEKIKISTGGNPDLIDLTGEIKKILDSAKVKNGNLTVFVIGSTVAITTFEFEPGLIKDINEICEKLIPTGVAYHHDETWQDDNGASHLRAMLFGPSLVIPFENGSLLLGTWQQVVLAEFDTRPRQRTIVVQLIGE